MIGTVLALVGLLLILLGVLAAVGALALDWVPLVVIGVICLILGGAWSGRLRA